MDSGMSKLDHLDENLLAAFAEDALMPQERQLVLQHLATCQRCRETAFLTQDAAPENLLRESSQRKGSTLVQPPARPSWWRPLWTTGLFAAMLIATLIAVLSNKRHQHSPTRRDQIASIETKPLEVSKASSSMGGNAQTSAVPLAAKAQGPKKRSFESRGKSHHERLSAPATVEPAGTADNLLTLRTPVPNAFPRQPQAQQQSEHFASVHGAGASHIVGGIAAARNAPALATNASAASASAVAGTALARGSTVAVAASPAPLIQGSGPRYPFLGQGAAALVQPKIVFRIDSGIVNRCEGVSCTPVPPPNALPVVSVAFSGESLVALDANGDLFASSNSGTGWEAVATQWAGKARSVQLGGQLLEPASTLMQSGVSGSFLSATRPASPTRQTPATPIFELTTEDGRIWQSVDLGKTWRLKK
jgi:Putative zinc-finger